VVKMEEEYEEENDETYGVEIGYAS